MDDVTAPDLLPDNTTDHQLLVVAEALWDYLPTSRDQLEFNAGQLIEVNSIPTGLEIC